MSDMPTSRLSSSGLTSMSLSRPEPPQSSRQARRHRSFRSSSRWREIRLPAASRELGSTGRQRHRPVDSVDRSLRQATRALACVVPGLRRLAILANAVIPSAHWRWGRFRLRLARSGSRSLPPKSDERRISGPPSMGSRIARMQSMSFPTRWYRPIDVRISTLALGARLASISSASRLRRSGGARVLWSKHSGSFPTRR